MSSQRTSARGPVYVSLRAIICATRSDQITWQPIMWLTDDHDRNRNHPGGSGINMSVGVASLQVIATVRPKWAPLW